MHTSDSKERWRNHFRDALSGLPDAERRHQNEALARRVLALPELRPGARVLICLSFGPEPDTWGLLEPLQRRGLEVVVPRTVPTDRSLDLVPWPCALETRSFGLREPAKHLAALDRSMPLDVALVLALGFDRRGIRLGHGAGYFDRFFAAQGATCRRIGLAFDCQLVDRLPREHHDVAMDVVVTPGQTVASEGTEGLGD